MFTICRLASVCHIKTQPVNCHSNQGTYCHILPPLGKDLLVFQPKQPVGNHRK